MTSAFPAIRVLLPALLLGAIGVHAAPPPTTIGFPLVTAYAQRDTGRDMLTMCMVQDQDGTLFFGGRQLLSFDGDRWRVYPIGNTQFIRALQFDRDGRLWAAAVGEIGWFERQVDATWSFHSLRDRLPPELQRLGDVWRVFVDGKYATFFTDDKVLRWNGRSFDVWRYPLNRRVRGFRLNGATYFQDEPTGLYRLTDAGPELVLSAADIGTRGIGYVRQDSDGWFLITGNGVFKYSDHLQSLAPDATNFITHTTSLSCTAFPDGRIAVCTDTAGIGFLRSDGSLEAAIDESSGLPTSHIEDVQLDRQGNMWAMSQSTVMRITRPDISLLDVRSGLGPKMVTDIARFDGRLFVSTETAALQLGADQHHFEPEPAISGYIHSLLATRDGLLAGAIWGATRFQHGRSEVFSKSNRSITFIRPSQRHSAPYLALEPHGVTTMASDGKRDLIVDGLPDTGYSLAEDHDGNLWIGTLEGPYFATPLKGQVVHAVPLPASYGVNNFGGFTQLRSDAEGRVFVLAPAGGWVLQPSAHALQPIENYPARKAAAVSNPVGENGALWIVQAADDGRPFTLGRVTRHDGSVRWTPHSLEGLQAFGQPASMFAEAPDSSTTEVWIGGTSGVLHAVIRGEPSAPKPTAPLLHIFAQTKLGDRQVITAPLPYSTAAIEFEFAEPDFAHRASLRLETSIAGIDRGWMPADSSSRRTLTAVRDGKYIFRVRAVAETGMISDSTEFRFEVLPPWWRTAPAIACGLFSLLPFGYGAYRLRVRQLRRRNVELEAKVRRRTEQLEQANAAKTAFVASMSHDIRNPLNGIVGLTLALEDSQLDAKQREIVATLRECTTYLSTLVDDVLDFAQIEAGKVELRVEAFSASQLLHSVATALQGDIAQRGASVAINVDPELPARLQGDPGRIQQILVNYVSNALKYGGGEIKLIALLAQDSVGEVEFAVVDNGTGITPEERATLFTKFTRLDAAKQKVIPGTGLGLASCRALADLMGGLVGVESGAGQGTRFYLRLPLTVAAPTPEPAPSHLPNTTVLLVEDTDYNAMAATAVLAKLGLRCIRARNGEEALRLFAAQKFNLVLLDRNLPDMDGTAVARRIRELETEGSRAILLAVTAYCTAEDRQLCLDAGMDTFVGKPLTPDKLRKALQAPGNQMLAAESVHVAEPASAPPRSTKDFDLKMLHFLADGTAGSLDRQIDRFLAELRESETQVVVAQRTGDYAAVTHWAHHITSQARMVHASALADASLRLELAARAADSAACPQCLAPLLDEIRGLTEALNHHRSAAPTA